MTSHLPEPAWADAYLAALEATGLPHTAARSAGVTVALVNKYAAQCREFEVAAEEAEERFADALEAEAIRRAKDGVTKVIYHQGRPVGTEQQYSDSLMSQLLKGRRAKRYGDKKEINLNTPVQVILAPIAQLPGAAAAAIEATAVTLVETVVETVVDEDGFEILPFDTPNPSALQDLL